MKNYKNIILVVLLSFLGLTSCKKNEESFTLEDDIVTVIHTYPKGAGEINEDIHWVLTTATVYTSTVDATGQLIFGDTKVENGVNGQLLVAKDNSLSLLYDSKKQICKWLVVNNDQIAIDSLIWLTDTPTKVVAEVEYSKIKVNTLEELNNFTNYNVDPAGEIPSSMTNLSYTANIENMYWQADYAFKDPKSNNETRIIMKLDFQRVTSDHFAQRPLLMLKP
ncbi:MAG: hypothetical protein ACPG6V_10020 [Flavobacteriales bacterium]